MTTVRWKDGSSVTFGGFNRACCFSCRRVFGGVSGFDKHRKGNKCLDPATLGMELSEGIWIQPLKPGVFANG